MKIFNMKKRYKKTVSIKKVMRDHKLIIMQIKLERLGFKKIILN